MEKTNYTFGSQVKRLLLSGIFIWIIYACLVFVDASGRFILKGFLRDFFKGLLSIFGVGTVDVLKQGWIMSFIFTVFLSLYLVLIYFLPLLFKKTYAKLIGENHSQKARVNITFSIYFALVFFILFMAFVTGRGYEYSVMESIFLTIRALLIMWFGIPLCVSLFFVVFFVISRIIMCFKYGSTNIRNNKNPDSTVIVKTVVNPIIKPAVYIKPSDDGETVSTDK